MIVSEPGKESEAHNDCLKLGIKTILDTEFAANNDHRNAYGQLLSDRDIEIGLQLGLGEIVESLRSAKRNRIHLDPGLTVQGLEVLRDHIPLLDRYYEIDYIKRTLPSRKRK